MADKNVSLKIHAVIYFAAGFPYDLIFFPGTYLEASLIATNGSAKYFTIMK